MGLQETLQGFLPEALQDFWFIVPVWAAIILVLVVVLIIKILNKKKGQAAVSQFKTQNAPQQPSPSIQQPQQQKPAQQAPQQKPQQQAQQPIPQQHKTIMEKHEVHVPHEEYHKLDAYIEAMFKRGMPPQLIGTYLVNVGWDPQIVSQHMQYIIQKMRR